MTIVNLKYNEYDVELHYGIYLNNGRHALSLIDKTDTEPIATCTINLPTHQIEKDEVAIKSYSENEGMLEWLMKYKIVSKPIRFVPAGFVVVPICKLLIQPN